MSSPTRPRTAEDPYIAIDFGTAGSRIAYPRGGGGALLTLLSGETEIPSVLMLSAEGGMLAGGDAVPHRTIFPRETVTELRSLLTADPAELEERGPFFPHPRAAADPALLTLECGDRPRSVVELTALYLLHLRESAEIGLERPVASVVLTVPVAFTPFDRQVLHLAAGMAGFERVRLIDEPTAVALAWLEHGARGRMAICSWGAGYFSASIAELQADLVRVRSSVGSARLGGGRLDLALARDFLGRLPTPGEEGRKHETQLARHLLGLAHVAREEISAKGKASLQLRLTDAPKPMRHTYTKDNLKGWLDPMLTTATELCAGMLADAGLRRDDLDGLLLAGGMTAIPEVSAHLQEWFQLPQAEGVAPNEAAVHGALVRARFLERELADPLVLDGLPLALALEGQGGRANPLMARGEAIPASRGELFTTYLERQTDVSIQLLGHQGAGWEPLASVELSRIPPMKEGEPQLEVVFQVEENGMLSVEAREGSRGKPLAVEVRPRRGLRSGAYEAVRKELPRTPEGDFPSRLRDMLRTRGHLLLGTLQRLLSKHAEMMTRDEKQVVKTKAQELTEVLEGGDPVEMRSCAHELSEATEPVLRKVIGKSLETLLR